MPNALAPPAPLTSQFDCIPLPRPPWATRPGR